MMNESMCVYSERNYFNPPAPRMPQHMRRHFDFSLCAAFVEYCSSSSFRDTRTWVRRHGRLAAISIAAAQAVRAWGKRR